MQKLVAHMEPDGTLLQYYRDCTYDGSLADLECQEWLDWQKEIAEYQGWDYVDPNYIKWLQLHDKPRYLELVKAGTIKRLT